MKEQKSIFRGLCVGLLAACLITILLLLILAWLYYKLKLSGMPLAAGACGIYLLASGLGGFLAGKRAQLRRFFWGALTGLLYFVLIFIISTAVNAGIPSPDGFLTALLLCTGGGMLGAILS